MTLSGLPALDAAIGLAALFFLLATVCSSINEAIASVLAWRAKTLEDAIDNVLGDKDLTKKLFDHWRVKSLVRDPASTKRRRNRPSYLPPRAFSRALAEIVAELPATSDQHHDEAKVKEERTPWKRTDDQLFDRIDKVLEDVPNEHLRALVSRATKKSESKLDGFRDTVETTFDDAMERASGWYKRKVSVALAIIAAVLAIGLNVDTVRVTTYLLNDASLRAAVSQRAAAIDKDPKGTAAALDQVKQLNVPVGWGPNGPAKAHRSLGDLAKWSLLRVPGWFITIAALTLGAPFWFDLLSRFARLRSAGVTEKPRSLSDTAGARGT